MKLSATYQILATRERVFAALTDPAVLQRLIEGCESLVRRDDGVYEAKLRMGLGSIKGTYTGEARMEDVTPPESYTLHLSGKGGPGFVKGSARMRLRETSVSDTSITCVAEVQVGGTIMAVGSRLIEVTARRMMDRFFAGLAVELGSRV